MLVSAAVTIKGSSQRSGVKEHKMMTRTQTLRATKKARGNITKKHKLGWKSGHYKEVLEKYCQKNKNPYMFVKSRVKGGQFAVSLLIGDKKFTSKTHLGHRHAENLAARTALRFFFHPSSSQCKHIPYTLETVTGILDAVELKLKKFQVSHYDLTSHVVPWLPPVYKNILQDIHKVKNGDNDEIYHGVMDASTQLQYETEVVYIRKVHQGQEQFHCLGTLSKSGANICIHSSGRDLREASDRIHKKIIWLLGQLAAAALNTEKLSKGTKN